MRCPHCAQDHPDNCKFCPITGKEIIADSVAVPAQPIRGLCPFCQRPIVPGQLFCPSCGKSLEAQDTERADNMPDGVAPSLLSEACPNCGKTLPRAGILFCPSCGFKLQEARLPEERTTDQQQSLQPISGDRTPKSNLLKIHPFRRIWPYFIGGIVVIAGVVIFILARSNAVSPLSMIPIPTASDTVLADTATPTGVELAALPSDTPVPSSTLQPPPSVTHTATRTVTSTPNPSPTITDTALPTWVNPYDNAPLVYVPAGTFLMGSDSASDPYFWGAEAPAHQVFVTESYIYRLEVTNAQYAQCVLEHQCPLPEQSYSHTRREYYDNPRFDDYPVIYVTYSMATSYCVWAGGRLPSEAEWEKAARGTDGRLFPWGSTLPNANLANYLGSGIGDSVAIGSYPQGASAYGALDMGGNVLEWVYDRFDETYYRFSALDNPFGPATGNRRVIRGGAWASDVDGLRTVARASLPADQSREMVGFRCMVETLP